MSSNGKDGVVTLGGREFKRVKAGLDEAQVASFIDDLIRERDVLAKSQHHIASLTKLAETTIVEADRLANQLKTEAAEQGKAESAAIIDRAKEQAQQMAEKKRVEVLEIANEKASAIQSEAEKKAVLLLEDETRKIQDALRTIINEQFACLLAALEGLKQQAAATQADFEDRLAPSTEENGAAALEPREESGAVTMQPQEEGATAVAELEGELSAARVKEGKAPDEDLQPIHTVHQSETGWDLSKLLEIEDRTELGEPQFEVEILPPIHMRKMMEVVAHLDELPEVENTEIIPRVDMPAILVFLREQVNLVDVLRTSPAVAHVEEISTDSDATNGETGKQPKKVRIGLSGDTMSQEKE